MDQNEIISCVKQLRAITQLQSQLNCNPEIILSTIEKQIIFDLLEKDKNEIKNRFEK